MTADTVGGVWTYAVDLCRALAPHGVHVSLATMGAPLNDAQSVQARALANVRVHESRYKLEWMQDPWDDVRRAGDWLLDLARDAEPDVVHLNGYAHGALPWDAPTIIVGHSCVLSWWQAVKREPAPAEWARYGDEVRTGLRAADLVVAPSAAMLAALDRHYGPLSRTTVIRNGRDGASYWPAAKEPFILCAGRTWDEAKNLGALDRVAPELGWPVYAAGDERGPDGAGTTRTSVIPLGRLSEADLATWYGRASIYALPARYEPFGLSAVEAALSGCALVLGDIDSLREVWGDAALFVAPEDDDSLCRAIRRLIDSPALRQEMARRATTRAARYTPARMADGYLKAYEAVLSNVAPAPTRDEARLVASVSLER